MWNRKGVYGVGRVLTLWVLALLLSLLPTGWGAAPERNVLILNSYHSEYKWTDEASQGILDALGPLQKDIKVYNEYMGTKWAYHEEYLAKLPEIYRSKYRYIPLDLIVTTDDDAFNFMLDHGAEVFGEVPVVFCGVNWLDPKRLEGRPNYTGVNEAADIRTNFDLMLKLHPAVRQIYVIVDNTTTGLIVQQKVKALAPQYQDRVTFHLLNDMEVSEIYQQVHGLGTDSLVFMTIFQKDREGVFLEYDEITRGLSEASAVPVYGLWDFNLDYGILGGMLTSGYQQGYTAGQLAQRILQGEAPADLPPVMESPNRYRFDYVQLDRFGIPLDALPVNSEVINRPRSFYEENRTLVHLTVGFIGLLMAAIALLLSDIRKRKRVQLELKRSESRLAEIIEFLPVATFVIDKSGTVMTWNRAIEAMTGVPAEAVLGKGDHAYSIPFYGERRPVLADLALMTPEVREPLLQTKYSSVASIGDMLVGETDLAQMKGEERNLIGWAHPLYNEKGEVFGAIETIQDVTDKKKADQLRIARDAAEAANRAKSQFLANMSHELRTPLNAILGFSQIMARDEAFPERFRSNLEIILKSGDHLLDLINNVLDLAKIESGKITYEPEDFDLGALIDEVILMLQLRAEAKGISLFLDQSSSFPRYVNSDPVKLRQVLINIAGNAVKFTRQGQVSLRLGVLPPLEEDPRLQLRFEVSDTGPGIPEADLERIFNPFEQSVNRSEIAGTGLGLAIAREYITMMGGTVSVRSEEGKGSVFSFTLLCGAVDAGQVKQLSLGHSVVIGIEGAEEKRILVVEDQWENRQFMRQVLEPFGFQLKEALDGQEAIAAVLEWQPHLVLMDRRMPGMDGIQATREIRRRIPGPSPRIVAVTAHAYLEEQKEMLDAGCDAFLRKPVRERELFQVISVQLGLKCLYDPSTQGLGLEAGQRSTWAAPSFEGVPLELLEALRHAVMGADLDGMLECIDTLETLDRSAAEALRAMAKRYDYEGILNLLGGLS